MQLLALLRREKHIGRKKNQTRPALAFSSRDLRQRQLTVGEWPKSVGEILNGVRRGFRHCHFSLRRGRTRRQNYWRRESQRLGWPRLDIRNRWGRKVSFDPPRRIGFHFY